MKASGLWLGLLLGLWLTGCASDPAGQSPAPRPPETCDAFGCCADESGRRRCCEPRFDPACEQRTDPFWREREAQRRRDERSRERERLPLPPVPRPPLPGLPRL